MPETHPATATFSRSYIRASIGAFNTIEGIETLVRAVAEIARNG